MSSDPRDGFVVDQPAYHGDLGGLAYALRSGTVAPRDLRLAALVRDALAWFHEAADRDLEHASTALPALARVLELKLRLSLPRPPRDADTDAADDASEVEEALEAVAVLEDLETAIDFLRTRRHERAAVVPASTPRPELPRRRRPHRTDAGRLAQLAASLRPGRGVDLAFERLTLEAAGRALRDALARVRRGVLSALGRHATWAERTITFAAFLELVREGRVRAEQAAPFEPIEVEATDP